MSPVVPASSSSTQTWRLCSVAGALNRVCGSRLASESSARWALTNFSRSRPYASSRSRGGAPGPSGGGPKRKACCWFLLVFVEQHDHQARAAAEPAEQRAFADARGLAMSSVVTASAPRSAIRRRAASSRSVRLRAASPRSCGT